MSDVWIAGKAFFASRFWSRTVRLKINSSQIGSIELIDDGYNANPASISAALTTLGKKKAKRRIAILGDMKELGSSEIDYHKKIASFDVISKLDYMKGVYILRSIDYNLIIYMMKI